jgi:hypothetical protein
MKKKSLLYFLLLVCAAMQAAGIDTGSMIKGYPAAAYLDLIREYYADENYEAALSICDTVVKYKPATIDVYRSQRDIYLRQSRWDEAIKAATKEMQLDSTSVQSISDYFEAYHQSGKNTEAVDIYKTKVKPIDSVNKVWRFNYQSKNRQAIGTMSRVGVAILIIGLLLVSLLFYYRDVACTRSMSLPFMIFIPGFVTCILYFLFFHFSAMIWSGNEYHPALSYNPYGMRGAVYEHDGNEAFVLYALSLVSLLLSIVIMYVVRSFGPIVRSTVLVIFASATFCLFLRIGFYPPYEMPVFVFPLALLYTGIFIVLVRVVTRLIERYPHRTNTIVGVILFFVCFLICDWFSVYDYGFILSPALRLYYGDRIRDIYFQYDLFLSFIGLMWLKLKLSLNYFYLISESTYYLLFFGLFVLSKRLFANKRLPFLMLAFAVLMRYYASMGPNAMFQVTPLRLDLWFVLLWLVYWRGAYNVILGVTLGLLVIFHRNFGIIYLASYILFLSVLLCIDLSIKSSIAEKGRIIGKHIRFWLPNMAIVIIAFACLYMILGSVTPDSALDYRKIGINMMRISDISFFWYVPMLLGIIALLLIRNHERLSEQYINTGIFLLLLTVGESLYFFGRSHEHNIVNLGAIYSLCLFYFLDLLYAGGVISVSASETERAKVALYHALPYLFLITGCLYYPWSIKNKLCAQGRSLKELKCAMPIDFSYDFQSLHDLTGSSDRIFFLEFERDFLYYYYGHYKPSGYFTPNDSWVFKKDMAAMMQHLLDSGYYIVPTDYRFADELLQLLEYNAYGEKGGCRVFYKKPMNRLLDTAQSVVSRSFADRLPDRGIDVPAVTLGRHFSLECILDVDSTPQPPFATLLSNLHQALGCQGIELCRNDAPGYNYVFRYGNNEQLKTSAPFAIIPGVYHYIAITKADSILTVYIDGSEVSKTICGADFADSDRPVMIGNNKARNSSFHGLIREIKLVREPLNPDQVSHTWSVIQQKRPG